MLFYGIADLARFVEGPKCRIYSFTSFAERYPRLQTLIPPNFLGASSEKDFDINYMHYVFDVDTNFFEFMNCIVEPLYQGMDVYLCIANNEWSEIMIESLLKMIQQRYGYNATRIEHINDLFNAEITDFEPTYGLMNLDEDNKRFAYLVTQNELRGGPAYVPPQ